MSTSSLLSNNRRVAVFIAAGIAVAALAGLSVWKLGTPHPPSEPIRPATAQTSDSASPSPRPTPSPSRADGSPSVTATEPTEGTENYAGLSADDPFLAPHAWTEPSPQPITPTRVYRPTNPGPEAPAPHHSASPSTPSTQPGEPATEPVTPATPSAEDTPHPTGPAEPNGHQPSETTPSTPPGPPPSSGGTGSLSHPSR
ncbi:hypothetical protein L1O03_02555 [Corynebacterium uropygiale]|uniref:Uncharacterized protein n=1 Tax=Corynebacterium uropygiale TaxID=1775911 RepID=A0A9X1QS76_9CORY|nr:hypothetical protein [Corynebacterium uropygiale]MCF4006060.1 hypothetical protein [Corynebacterium uropygiale]